MAFEALGAAYMIGLDSMMYAIHSGGFQVTAGSVAPRSQDGRRRGEFMT